MAKRKRLTRVIRKPRSRRKGPSQRTGQPKSQAKFHTVDAALLVFIGREDLLSPTEKTLFGAK